MNIKTQEKIGYYFIRGWFAFVFVATLLYVVYEPMTNLIGTYYKTAWVYGVAFGFTFVPVTSWILKPIITAILEVITKYRESDK